VSSNQQRVTVVTDSTADVPAEIAAELGIVTVPLRINFGQESLRDQIDLTTEELIRRMESAPALPTTSQPTPAEFAATFQEQVDAGSDVVCVTIGDLLSGTHRSALTGAEQVAPDRITVVDGATTTMHLGWAVIEGARAARAGADRETVATAVRDARARSNLFVVLRTLDYVYKGGRIGKVGQLVGSALNIKPIISVRDGRVTAIERVRTWKKAVRRLVELAQDEGDLSDIMVLYVDDRSDADVVLAELRERFPNANVGITRAGAVITTHVGPGAIAVATLRRA
jgi:DegV family protein with EDD domain